VACVNSEQILHAYFDGELDLVRSVELEEHLKTCPDCSRELRDQHAMRQSLRSSNLYERAPESLRTRIHGALPREVRPKAISRQRRALYEWLAVAAALILAVGFGAKVVPNIGGRGQANALVEEIAASHIRSLQPGHLFDVQSTDQHTVKPWFDGKLDFAPPVTDFASQGFPLVGGRLDYLDGRDVAALVYQRNKHLINVFIWPEQSTKAQLPAVQSIQGYNLIYWQHDSMNFCAVSDLNGAELGQLAQLLKR
jgi:anti-sigma factor (TIGR02949 family)